MIKSVLAKISFVILLVSGYCRAGTVTVTLAAANPTVRYSASDYPDVFFNSPVLSNAFGSVEGGGMVVTYPGPQLGVYVDSTALQAGGPPWPGVTNVDAGFPHTRLPHLMMSFFRLET